MKHKNEQYKLIWKERIGFARLAIQHGVPIVPMCFALCKEVQTATESQIGQLLEIRNADPERYPIQHLLRRLSSRLA